MPLVLLSALALPLPAQSVSNKPGLFLPMQGALPTPAAGEKKPKQDKTIPVTIEADEMGYDRDNAIVIARGHVTAVQGKAMLQADQVTYYQQRDLVVADGNVVMLQPSGDVFFADHATLHDAMKKGLMDALKARLSDNSVLVGNRGEKVNSAVTKLHEASYTPCSVCEAVAPFWQLNAERAKIDELDERVTYHNVDMDLLGVPVLYSPYLSHPTPDSTGSSGFLMPGYKTGGTLGSVVKQPYYWRIDEDKDAVITPWYTSEEGWLLQGNYRQLTDNGNYQIDASITDPDKLDDNGNVVPGHAPRGAIFAKGQENLDDTSRVGFDIERATDDTYLQRYDLGAPTVLFSRAFLETADGRNFGQLQGLAIQGLQATDDPKTTPLVMPMLQGYYETLPDENNIRYHVSGDAQSLTRDTGVDQRRVSLTVGASHPYITDGGDIFTTTLNMRQDFYNTDDLPLNGGEFSGTTMRSLPQAALEWRYPLINQFTSGAVTVEPIVLAVLQANGGNPATISNEDNRLVELSDTNLFSLDRMPGLDTVDSGPRAAYGFRSQYLLADGTSFDALFGQNYSVNANTPFPNSSTPGDNFSDYIGRIGFTYQPVSVAYRFAFDSDTLATDRSEVTLNFSKPWLSFSLAYRLVDYYQLVDNATVFNDNQEGSLDVTLPLDSEWSLYSGARRDFDLGQMVSADAGVIYKNECFNVTLAGLRTYARDRDVTPSSSFTVTVGFKNLGEFGGK